MIEEKLSNAFDRYGIETNASPKPWITRDHSSGLHHHLLLEILPSTFKDTWLNKFVATQYRWKISVWSRTNERISSDQILPILTAKHSFHSLSDTSLVHNLGESKPLSRPTSTSVSHSKEVLVLDLDFAANSLQRSHKVSPNGPNTEWFVEDGVHLVVEIVHEASGIPVSRGIIPLKPQEGFDSTSSPLLDPYQANSGRICPPRPLGQPRRA